MKDQQKDLVSLSEDDVIWFNEKRITGAQSVQEIKPSAKELGEARSNFSAKVVTLGSRLIANQRQITRSCSLTIS